MSWKKGMLGLTVGVGVLIGGQSAFASQELNIETRNTVSTITLDWNDVGNTYEIYNNRGKKIWSGTQSEFTQSNLQKDNKYDYTLKVLNSKKEIINEMVIKTTTKKEQASSKQQAIALNKQSIAKQAELNEQEKLYATAVTSTLTDQKVTISWDGEIPDDDGVLDVYRNGQKIGSTTQNNFSDSNVEANKEYVYEFIGNKKMSDEEINQIKEELKKNETEITKEQEELFYDTYSLTRTIKTDMENPNLNSFKENKLSTNEASLAATASPAYMMRYTTFIPMKYAKNPFAAAAKTEYFNGNNRGFNVFSDSFKTRMDVMISFPNGKGTATLPSSNKQVGTTYYYDKDYNQIGKATASSSGMNIRDVVSGTNKVSYNAYHDIGIPYLNALTPDITYSYNATVYSDGRYNITGSHDKAPSHEMYIAIPYSDVYGTIHQKSHVDFNHLLPIYPNYSINASS